MNYNFIIEVKLTIIKENDFSWGYIELSMGG